MHTFRFLAFVGLLALLATGCQRQAAAKLAPATTGEPPHLLLISLDGFRWDYVERFQPPHLSAFAAGGVRAEGLISCFPSKTFPNHYSVATGMYPNNHGLVNNSYYDREKGARYTMYDRDKVESGDWYGGTPIWVQAMKSGMVAASFFFVGSEADVQGMRPNYYYRYDGKIPNAKRVQQALDWLAMPVAERPRMIAMYFSDMDDVGHRHGPKADDQLREKLMALDEALGTLFAGVAKTGLPVNIIIVSDHGMSPINVDQLMAVERLEDDERYLTVNSGALAHFYLHEGVDAEAAFAELKAKEQGFKVYRTAEVPYFEVPPTHHRWGDFIAIPDEGRYFVNARTLGMRQRGPAQIGEHGFDPERRDMHGIFYAKGPALKEDLTIPPFKNIHIYPLMCALLGMEVPAEVDGRLEVLEGVLRKGGGK